MMDQLEDLAAQELEVQQLERLLANLSDEAVLTQEEVGYVTIVDISRS